MRRHHWIAAGVAVALSLASVTLITAQQTAVADEKDFPCYSLSRDNYNCSSCIQLHKSCAWCKARGFDDNNKFSRCDSLRRLQQHGCADDEIQNPQTLVSTVEDRELSNSRDDDELAVQLRPQRMSVKLRPRESSQFE